MPAAVREMKIHTSVMDDTGSLEVTIQMEEPENDSEERYIRSEKDTVYLWAQLTDRNGTEADRIFPVPAEGEVQFCMQADTPVLWNAEDPYLYDLVLELRDAQNRLLGCTVKKIAFYRWEEKDGILLLNGKEPGLRVFSCTEADGEALAACKRSFCNAVVLPKEKRTQRAHELCLEYGVYLLEAEKVKTPEKDGGVPEKNPDFELNVINQGVLVENKSIYVNADRYELYYSLKKEGADRLFSAGILTVDIPAGASRYVELEFCRPDEPGNYIYHAALRIKEKTPWADQGAEIAVSEIRLANLFLGN